MDWRDRERRTYDALGEAAEGLSYAVGRLKAIGAWPEPFIEERRAAAWDAVKARDREVLQENREPAA